MQAKPPIKLKDRQYAVRCETGRDADGSTVGLLTIGLAHQAIVVGVRQDMVTRTWTEALGRFSPDAISAGWQDLWEAMPKRPARQALLNALGLFGAGDASSIIANIHHFGKRYADPVGLRRSSRLYRTDFHNHDQAELPFRPTYTGLAGNGMGPPSRAAHCLQEADSCVVRQTPGAEAIPDMIVVASGRGPRGQGGRTRPRDAVEPPVVRLRDDGNGTLDNLAILHIDHPAREIETVLAGWVECLAHLLTPSDLWFLPIDHWSNELVSHYSVPGQVGEYRRQAGALYPFLSPMLAVNPRISALVDAGRPYEAEMAAELGGWLGNEAAGSFTPAKLRRMRGIDSLFPSSSLIHLLWLTARLPLDVIPPTVPQWIWYIGSMQALRVDSWGRKVGLELVTTLPTRSDGKGAVEWREIPDLNDMAMRCTDTLVAPLLGKGVLPTQARIVAARLLLEGMSFRKACEVSRHWHERLDPFERDLPEGRDLVSWPALFEPRQRGGVRISCLTVPSALRDEGCKGPDRNGLAGLEHCVGGFGLSCWIGTVQILSVSRLVKGAWRRSSTVELRVAGKHKAPDIKVRQHQAWRNTPPRRTDVVAIERLLADLADGTLACDPAAFDTRSASAYKDGVDWADAGALESSLKAWRPHLPRKLAGLDVEGMRAHLRAEYARALAERGSRRD